MKAKKYDKTTIQETLHRFYKIEVTTSKGVLVDITNVSFDKPYYRLDPVIDTSFIAVNGIFRPKNSAFFEAATGLEKLDVSLDDDFEVDHIDIELLNQAYQEILSGVPTGKFDDIYLEFFQDYDGAMHPAIVGTRKETDEEFNARVEAEEQERKIEHEKYLARKKKREERKREELKQLKTH